ncbi:MAG: Uma2 family endonuclease [Acidobacteriota bacterium]
MSAEQRVSVQEYLATAYRPDRDYVEGVVEERNLGEFDHSRLQLLIAAALMQGESRHGFIALTEQRVQVKPDRFRIPDVCIIRKQDREQIVTKAPLLCVEILSPEDTHTRLVVRLEDYLALGVPECWVVDPKLRRGYVYSQAGLIPAHDGVLTLAGTNLSVDLAPLFAQL